MYLINQIMDVAFATSVQVQCKKKVFRIFLKTGPRMFCSSKILFGCRNVVLYPGDPHMYQYSDLQNCTDILIAAFSLTLFDLDSKLGRCSPGGGRFTSTWGCYFSSVKDN